MPRRARIAPPGFPLHIIQRGNNRQACFRADEDRSRYLSWFGECAERAGCRIHAFVLMNNHVHLLCSADAAQAPAQLMKAVAQRYAQYFNRRYDRSGTLWEGRFRSCVVQTERYLLVCQRYIELNPVRAGLVTNPADYRWSSYRANALGETSDLLTPHETYLALGADGPNRRSAYRELFRDELGAAIVDEIRKATNGNYALGDASFTNEIVRATGHRATPGTPGRPRKVDQPEPGGPG
ncbi:transposase [Accumulibacter sp.]|uniref:transposase n=1 Tax=Accumulibacter sp. TaxID=2053492 RepID=UPI0025D090CC|nr:transposase [Accumulibacter sp.]MCM8594476.1 transposase [Accumulibacter sp.]MCM8626741.1 transposase [Accumulibacter sp.]MDS4048622.1 transposase [Accumulibacter sp.]